MHEELRKAIFEAAGRGEVIAAVETVYSVLADEIDARRPVCKTSGRCCRFEEFGHRLYVSTMELAKFVKDLAVRESLTVGDGESKLAASQRSLPIFPSQIPRQRASSPPGRSRSVEADGGPFPPALEHTVSAPVEHSAKELGCRFQIGGLCTAHAIRPFGCRIFFCDETSTQWQHDVYERLHGELRRLHDALNVPYHYVEWRFALNLCL